MTGVGDKLENSDGVGEGIIGLGVCVWVGVGGLVGGRVHVGLGMLVGGKVNVGFGGRV